LLAHCSQFITHYHSALCNTFTSSDKKDGEHNTVVQWLAVLRRIVEELHSNLRHETGYPELSFHDFTQAL